MLRREDRPLLTGRGRFVDDLAVAGALHLLLARSPHAHARIRSVDTGIGDPGLVYNTGRPNELTYLARFAIAVMSVEPPE